MKKSAIFFALICAFFFASSVSANGWRLDDVVDSKPLERGYWDWLERGNLGDVAQAGAGVVASYFGHEVAHDMAAAQESVPMEWNLSPKGIFLGRTVFISVEAKASDESVRSIVGAGLSSQISTTEVVIDSKARGAFGSGYILSSGLNEVLYPLAHFLSKDGYGDFGGLERANGDGDLFAGVVLLFGIRHLYILAGGKDPLRSLGPVKFDIALDPATDSAMAKFSVRF